MENDELLKIFDEEQNQLGVADRAEVHSKGHWHETFHCWFTGKENNIDYIYFQIRSDQKKDYPGLLDITAAGHILADETVQDGIREVREELGIEILFEELEALGVIKDYGKSGDFIDREFGHVFLYQSHGVIDDFRLQKEEVAGIVKAEFDSFYEFCLGERDEISVEGFRVNEDGRKVLINKSVRKTNFVPHEHSYFVSVAQLINGNIR